MSNADVRMLIFSKRVSFYKGREEREGNGITPLSPMSLHYNKLKQLILSFLGSMMRSIFFSCRLNGMHESFVLQFMID